MGADTEMLTKMFESAGQGPGVWDKMKGFMGKNHNLIAQLLSGAGADINATGGLGKNFNDTIVGNIGSQNILKVMQGMLGGKVAPGGGLKITDKGVQTTIPFITPEGVPGPNTGDNALDSDWMSKLYQESLGGGGQASPSSLTNPVAPSQPAVPQQTSANQIGAVLNPFAPGQLNLSSNDLAGLNPNQILAVAELKGRQDSEETSRFNSNVDAEYKLDIMRRYYNGELSAKAAQRELDDFQNKTQRMNAITTAYNAMKGTDTIQNYEYAQTPEGGNFKGTMAEFKAYDESGDYGNFRQAQKDPLNPYKGNFESWIKKYGNKGTTINLSPYERTKQTNLADREDDVLKPDYAQSVIEDMNKNQELDIPFEEGQASLISSGLTPPTKKDGKDAATAWETKVDERSEILKRAKVRARLDARIRQAYVGKIIVRKPGLGWYLDGKRIVKDPYAAK
jgi:hypothetical protein